MKGKKVLELGTGDDFSLLGISCHLKDYRFCWMLNNQLEIDLRRVGDFFPDNGKSRDTVQGYPFYFCSENIRYETFYLLGNHSADGDLLERYTQADYLLLIHELAYPSGPRGLVQEIRKIPQVLTAFEIGLPGLRESDTLITGVELCMLQHQIAQRNKGNFFEIAAE